LDNGEAIPKEKGEFLQTKFREIRNALDQDLHGLNTLIEERLETWVHWESPMRGWKFLNVDGAVRGNPGRASARGVIRGEEGEWVIGFSENLGQCSVVKAELHGLLRGLKIAKDIPIHKLWVQSDSNTVVGMLNNPISCHAEFSHLKDQCRLLIEWEGVGSQIVSLLSGNKSSCG